MRESKSSRRARNYWMPSQRRKALLRTALVSGSTVNFHTCSSGILPLVSQARSLPCSNMAVQIAAPLFLDIVFSTAWLGAGTQRPWQHSLHAPRFHLLSLVFIGEGFSAPPSYVRTDIVWPAIIVEAILLPWAWVVLTIIVKQVLQVHP